MAAATTATAKTVSQPLQLSSRDAAAANGTTHRRAAKPSGKVTLTSLTENNVSSASSFGMERCVDSVELAWNSEEDYQCGRRTVAGHSGYLLIHVLPGSESTVFGQVVQGST